MSIERSLNARQVAEELGGNERTIRRWCADGCPHTREADGRLRFNAREVELWMEREGREFGGGRPYGGSHESNRIDFEHHPFYRMFSWSGETLTAADKFDGCAVNEALAQPAPVLLALEREVLEGKRELTQEQVREYVEGVVRLKAALVLDLANGYMAAWLVREGEVEGKRKLTAYLWEKLGWFDCVVKCAFGVEKLDAE